MAETPKRNVSEKAAQRGEPSYVWREGQERRLDLIRQWGGERMNGVVLENGCGVGEYLARLNQDARMAVGMDVEFPRLLDAKKKNNRLVCAAGENLPFKKDVFNLVLSNEVIEHVENDRAALSECVRVMNNGSRLVLFCPNRGYPFETHGIYRKGEYRFGNKFFINYLPRWWRDKLAPHVRVYTRRDIKVIFDRLPVKIIHRLIIFGAYDNIIQKWPLVGKMIRAVMRFFEKTPLQVLGLSHFWVVEKQN